MASQNPKYKLTYFDIKGLGECIKYIFAYKQIPYELITIPLIIGEGPWTEIKKSMPFGQVPLLEVDGQRLYQSQAICEYLAREYGLTADSSWDQAHLSALGNSFMDLFLRIALYYYTREPEQKEKLRVDRETNTIPFYFSRYESILKEKGDFFNGSKVTWVDFYMVAGLETVNGMMGDDHITGKYPALEALVQRIWQLPGVKEYVAIRPPYAR